MRCRWTVFPKERGAVPSTLYTFSSNCVKTNIKWKVFFSHIFQKAATIWGICFIQGSVWVFATRSYCSISSVSERRRHSRSAKELRYLPHENNDTEIAPHHEGLRAAITSPFKSLYLLQNVYFMHLCYKQFCVFWTASFQFCCTVATTTDCPSTYFKGLLSLTYIFSSCHLKNLNIHSTCLHRFMVKIFFSHASF